MTRGAPRSISPYRARVTYVVVSFCLMRIALHVSTHMGILQGADAVVHDTVSSASTPSERKSKRMSPDDFEFTKVLGKGNYGKVMLATLKADPQSPLFAVKIVKKSGLLDDESLEHVLAENRVLQTLDHPFLVKLHYSFQTEDRLYFVMEYISGGELFFHIGREKRFSETRSRFYAGEILLALQYLHTHNIVYRYARLTMVHMANTHICIYLSSTRSPRLCLSRPLAVISSWRTCCWTVMVTLRSRTLASSRRASALRRRRRRSAGRPSTSPRRFSKRRIMDDPSIGGHSASSSTR